MPFIHAGEKTSSGTGHRSLSRVAGAIGYLLLAVMGLSTGLFIFFLILLGQPLRTQIGIIDPSSFEPISLDQISLTESSEDAVPWDQGGRTRVYVHPDFPIKKVGQKDPNIETILVFGVDSRGSSDIACRADSLILVTIDRTGKAVKLTSIMRDMQCRICLWRRRSPDQHPQ
jgi:hypothetical protein